MILFLAAFARVFLLAFQNQNVIGGHYLWAALTTVAITAADAAAVLLVVEAGWAALWPMMAGSMLGVLGAMWAHRRWVG